MEDRNNFALRDAGLEDRAAAQAVTLAAYEEYAASMPPFAWEAYRHNICETVGDPAPAEHIVAEQGGAIVGSVLLFPPMEDVTPVPGASFSNEWPEARLLAVLPAARGHGIAGALMEECARRAAEAGFQYLTLHTNDQMQVARHLYERMGFVRFPPLDFSPMEGVTIKGYRLDVERTGD